MMAAPAGAAAAGQLPASTPCAPTRTDPHRPELWWQPANSRAARRAQWECRNRCPLVERRRCLETALSSGALEGVWGGVIMAAGGRVVGKRAALARALARLEGVA